MLSRGTHFLIGLLFGGLVASTIWSLRSETEDAQLAHFREVREFVRSSFVRDVSDEQLSNGALHGMLASLDRYSRYYDSAERDALERETSGRYEGIGVVFRPPVEAGQVLFCLPGSPADRAGVTVGDTFDSLNGERVSGMSEERFREAIGSPRAGRIDVRLTRLDGSQERTSVELQELVDPTVRHTRIADEERHIGYISVLSFSNETPREFEAAFRFLRARGMQGLVIDLRRNYGGALLSAEAIAKRFIEEGVILRTEGRGDPKVTRADRQEARWADVPLVVLVDGDSASASEILAGALQDHRRAVIVGSPTFGKGLVQTIRRFDDTHTVAKVTSSYYYSPSGRNFDRSVDANREWGILPDISIELERSEQLRIHAFLGRYGPPASALPEIEAWQERDGLRLIDELPEDRQLEAALELFRGHRPGPNRFDTHG